MLGAAIKEARLYVYLEGTTEDLNLDNLRDQLCSVVSEVPCSAIEVVNDLVVCQGTM